MKKRSARHKRTATLRAVARPQPFQVLAGGAPLTLAEVLPATEPGFPPAPPVPGECLKCGKNLLPTAYSLIGTPYRRGGGSPDFGFDCSGFVRYVYQTNYRIEMPTSAPQQFQVGVPVHKAELAPGDLVFFCSRRHGWHVGLYVGDGSFIHAPKPHKNVMVSPLEAPYFKSAFVGARRIPLADAPVIWPEMRPVVTEAGASN